MRACVKVVKVVRTLGREDIACERACVFACVCVVCVGVGVGGWVGGYERVCACMCGWVGVRECVRACVKVVRVMRTLGREDNWQLAVPAVELLFTLIEERMDRSGTFVFLGLQRSLCVQLH